MNIALVLSGGTGARMGLDVPKQYQMIAGKPVIVHTLERRRRVIFRLRMDINGVPRAQILQKQTNPVVRMLNHQMDIQRLRGGLRDVPHVVQ